MKKPNWLKKKINLSFCRKTKQVIRDLNLHTVCEESLCPNIAECFKSGIATFMILGDNCTRKCSFCNVGKDKPSKIDYNEPVRIKEVVKKLKLNYVIITSPTRDDLKDYGAGIFCETVKEIKSLNAKKKVEILIPDFLGNTSSIEKVANCGADVISHNIETVPSLYMVVRRGADYKRSLEVLSLIKKMNNKVYTKSGLILGLGEKKSEIINVFKGLRKAGCDFLTLGQYLPPSLGHYPVKEYLKPEKFLFLEKKAYDLGFKRVKSSPYVRSSYLAHTFLDNSC